MLFNSFEFIFLFLPITLLIFFQIGRQGYYRWAIALLLAASIFFYSWWNPANLPLLVGSLLFNYALGGAISEHFKIPVNKKLLLTIGVVLNLLLISYFKYADFLISSSNAILGMQVNLLHIVLPLGISFFTFQQIAYLVDAYRGEIKKYTFLDYALFVSFFPHLIAGPLVQHKDILFQFSERSIIRFKPENFVVGITIFSMGLFKKVVFADNVALYAGPIFNAASGGASITLFDAWIGALAYTLQLYFDFSGYSDMAIGAARMFGIQMPLNFDSPYKSVNIVLFWRRWHITLSNFLRDYLYIPLGGNRYGEVRRNVNLMITMLLGGLWHGAGWSFVLWGGLHGAYLIINNQWRSLRKHWGHDLQKSTWWGNALSCLVTFVAVVVGWVFFRADSIGTAVAILNGMVGANGISLFSNLEPSLGGLKGWGVQFDGLAPILAGTDVRLVLLLIVGLLLIVWFTPNTQQWVERYGPALNYKASTAKSMGDRLWKQVQWRPNGAWAIVSAGITAIALLNLTKVSEFLYFEF
jgi:alginate O-acetyltransferase complex protein AlgI